MKHGAILVTGGAGYIGSHVVLQLRARGERVVVLDDLSRGFRQAVLDTPLVVGEVGDRDTVLPLLREHGVDTVMHFAAYTIVPESVSEPLKYYGNNTCSTRTLLECCVEAGRAPLRVLLDRRGVRHPGRRRRRGGYADRADQSLRHLQAHVGMDAARSWRRPRRCATWRCAISTSPAPTPQAASARRRPRRRCSSRWPARPSSASARRCRSSAPTTRPPTAPACATTSTSRIWRAPMSMRSTYLRGGGASTVLNCGYGHGYSVREVLESVERVAGQSLTVREEPRRAGDPPALVARAERIRACSAGARGSTTSTPSCAAPSAGSSSCCASPGEARSARVGGHGLPARAAGALGRMRRMRWGRPKSLSGLMLVGLALIAVPLLVAILTAAAADPRPRRHRPEDRRRGRHRGARQPGAVRADRLARAHRPPLRGAERPEAARPVPHPGRAPERHPRAAAPPGERRDARRRSRSSASCRQHPRQRHEPAGARSGPEAQSDLASRFAQLSVPGRARRAAEQRPDRRRGRRAADANARRRASACCGRPRCCCRSPGRGVRAHPRRRPAAAPARPRHQRARRGHLHQPDRGRRARMTSSASAGSSSGCASGCSSSRTSATASCDTCRTS